MKILCLRMTGLGLGLLWILGGLSGCAQLKQEKLARDGAFPSVPQTQPQPVVDEYHGVRVIDDYRWLEDFKNQSVKDWNAAQNSYTRRFLDRLPGRARIHSQLTELYGQTSASYSGIMERNGRFYALKRQPPLEQPMLVTFSSLTDLRDERVLLDPNQMDGAGKTSINLIAPSPEGKTIAVSLTQGGSEEGTLHLYDIATGKALPDAPIARVVFATGGGDVLWKKDGSGFYYTRYPRAGERPAEDLNFYIQVYFHKLGTAESQDQYVIGKEFPRIAEVFLNSSPDGRFVLVSVQLGDGGDFAHWLQGPDGAWKKLAGFEDGVKSATFGPDNELYLFSKKDAPRGKILRAPVENPVLSAAAVVVPESEAVIEGWTWAGNRIVPTIYPVGSSIYVPDTTGGPSRIRIFDRNGKEKGTVPLLPISAVGQIVPVGTEDLLFSNTSFIEPPAWFFYSAREKRTTRTPMATRSPVEFKGIEVVREFAISKDGTRVPLNIIRRVGTKLDGTNPVLLTGYGGYGITISPRYLDVDGWLWLEKGGVMAVANLRGGGEFGEQWHKAGNLVRKQNVFDDFIACAEHLIQARYTTPSRLAIQGGSNGGLLMGAVLTQRPELFRAVVAHVGIFDMLRVELEPNGAFNVPEFGTVKDPEHFKALYAYSPYHRVRQGVKYPAVLLVTGENDHRVNPYNSRKMAARLQAATGSGRPVLLRTSSSAGHGIGTALSESVAQEADVLAFLFDQLGMRVD